MIQNEGGGAKTGIAFVDYGLLSTQFSQVLWRKIGGFGWLFPSLC
jgi:hypothetical protein